MDLLDRFRSWFSRGDASSPLALPGPVLGGLTRRDATARGLALFEDMNSPPQLELREDSTVNPLTGLGGLTDKGAVARPNVYELGLHEEELLALHRANGLARKIIDILPDRATRKGWAAPDIPSEEEERLCIYDRVGDAWRWARLWGGAVILMVTKDDVPARFRKTEWEWLQQPLDLQRVGKLHALQVYDAREAWPLTYDKDRKSPGYREPLLWQLNDETGTLVVHASRVIWMRGAKRPPSERHAARWGSGQMPDDGILQAMWHEVRRLTETMQGGAILAHEIREKVLQVSGLADKLVGDEAKKFKARLSLMQQTMSALRILLIGENDKFESRSNSATGFNHLSDVAKSMLAAVSDIPETELYGTAPAGLNTDGKSAKEHFRQTVSDFQERNRSRISRIYRVLYASQEGPTRGLTPSKWSLEFRPLDEPDQKQVADTRLATAQMDKIYVELGVYGAAEIAKNRFGKQGYSSEMEAVPVPNPDEVDERAIEKARRMAEAEGRTSPPADEDEERADAADGPGCCVVVPAADPGLRDAVERALGQTLIPPKVEPHVTVIYLGRNLPAEALAEVVAVVADEAIHLDPRAIGRPAVRAFPLGPDGVPIVLEFEDAWSLVGLNANLVRRLFGLGNARQHRMYRAHLTLGYAPAELSVEAQAALLDVDVQEVRVAVAQLQVRNGGQVVATVTVGAESIP